MSEENTNKELQKTDDETSAQLKDSTKEITFATRQLEKSADVFDQKLQNHLKQLEQKITELAEENFALRKLPEKLSERLKELVPNISLEVQKKLFVDTETALKQLHSNADQLIGKIDSANQKVTELTKANWRRKFTLMLGVIVISAMTSGILSYIIIQNFPKTVRINTEGDINIENGDISIWGTGKNTIKETKKK